VIAGAPGPIGYRGRPGLQGATGYVRTGLLFTIRAARMLLFSAVSVCTCMCLSIAGKVITDMSESNGSLLEKEEKKDKEEEENEKER